MRLLAVTAVLVFSQLTGVVSGELVAVPSSLSRQAATPAPAPCLATGATSGTSWVLDVTGAQLSGVAAGDPPACYSVPHGGVPEHEHTGWFLLYVESGSIEFTLHEGIMWTTGEATLLPGRPAVTLNAGDWVLQDRATTHEYSNADPAIQAVIRTAFGASPLNGDGGCQGAC